MPHLRLPGRFTPSCSGLRLAAPQDYMDPQTAAELRTFDLLAVLAAVRSFAIGGARAPACGVIDGGGSEDGASDGQAHPRDDADHVSFRGITRDNNGRHQYWIALLYASLE